MKYKPRKLVPIEDRFWAQVQKADGCWLWTGTCDPKGYPGHLFLGTHKQNMEDCAAKKRTKDQRGSKNPVVKLSEGDVQNIRKTYAAGGISRRDLASYYSVSHGAVQAVIDRRSWTHV